MPYIADPEPCWLPRESAPEECECGRLEFNDPDAIVRCNRCNSLLCERCAKQDCSSCGHTFCSRHLWQGLCPRCVRLKGELDEQRDRTP